MTPRKDGLDKDSIWTDRRPGTMVADIVRIFDSVTHNDGTGQTVAFDIIGGRNGPHGAECDEYSPPRCRRMWNYSSYSSFLSSFKPYKPEDVVFTPLYSKGPTWTGGDYPTLEAAQEAASVLPMDAQPFAYVKVNRTTSTAEIVSS